MKIGEVGIEGVVRVPGIDLELEVIRRTGSGVHVRPRNRRVVSFHDVDGEEVRVFFTAAPFVVAASTEVEVVP